MESKKMSKLRGMFSSLSRSDSIKSKSLVDQQQHCNGETKLTNGTEMTNHRESPPSETTTTTTMNGQLLVAAKQEQPPKRSFSKRGKKKLSAMISRLNSASLGSKSKQSLSSTEQNNTSRADDSDDDELFCEPLCQVNSDDDYEQHQQDESTTTTKRTSLESLHAKSNSIEDDHETEDKDGPLPEEQCDIPTFLHTKDCDKELIERTRVLLQERFAKNPDNFYEHDYKRMLEDDWTVSRFLLRRRQDPKRTAKLMEECGRFRKQYKMSEVQLWEFPIEFHKPGGLFKYAPDRVGNLTVYMRVKMYRRVPEISDVFKAFILCVLEEADVEAKGRGVAVVFDLSGAGLQNVDLSFLSWLLSSFRNYCPKGVSYIMVYNLPWILSTTCRVAMTWLSATNRRALRFVHGDEIENFIAKENLPDYCGGTCKIDYCNVPEGSKRATEVCQQLDITPEQALKIKELFKEYLSDDDELEEISIGKKSSSKKSNKSNNKNNNKQQTLNAKPIVESSTNSNNNNHNHETTNNIDCDTMLKDQDHATLRTTNGQQDNFVSQASRFLGA